MIKQVEFTLKPRTRGFHLITQEVMSQFPELPETGLLNLFVKHTSCALSINENYDPSVRSDMERIYNNLVKENQAYYTHVDEGADEGVSYHTYNFRQIKFRYMARHLFMRVQGLWRSTSGSGYNSWLSLFVLAHGLVFCE